MSQTVTIETNHEDMIHDVQMDYYSRRFATCSSDRTIRIFDAEKQQLLATLTGHEGPVWGVQWAHPKFGSLLASCSYDRKVFVWKETAADTWSRIYEFTGHESSVNSIAFAPHEFGLILACASADGNVSILTHQADDSWTVQWLRRAHEPGVNAVSWAPAGPLTGVLDGEQTPLVQQLVTGGCDNLVKVWRHADRRDARDDTWGDTEATLEKHSDWVRDVAWAPNVGLPTRVIASCSEDHTVVVWSLDDATRQWAHKVIEVNAVVWRVSWSVTGSILAVSTGDNQVTLYKETVDGEWQRVSSVAEGGAVTLESSAGTA